MNAELERAADEAEGVCGDLMTVLEGKDISIGLAALFGALEDVGVQAERDLRALIVRDLRGLADTLEAMDAPKH